MPLFHLPPPREMLEVRACPVLDLMGTCCDWHSSILPALRDAPLLPALPASGLPAFASEWRATFFKEIHRQFQASEGPENIDFTHRKVLDQMLDARGIGMGDWGEDVRCELVMRWHLQIGEYSKLVFADNDCSDFPPAWPDSLEGIERLKAKFFVSVLANGTTRLQLDIVKSSKLPFDMLFSSELLGMIKPDPQIYLKSLALMGVSPHEAVMIAAHAYDLRAAKKIGMKTIYVSLETEDHDEDMVALAQEFDAFVDGTKGGASAGLVEVARLLGA
ncbi:hypothetical protein P7C70_g959, partial [Phenoliferia sp. Uapishka_3]